MPEDKPEKPESEDKPKARPGSAAPSRGKDAPVAKKDAAGTKKDAPPGTKSAGDKQKSGGPGSLDVKTVRLIIGGLVAAALVVVLAIVIFGGSDDESDAPAITTGQPIGVDEDQLESLAGSFANPVYWVGDDEDASQYEVTKTAEGQVYIRYLTGGASVGDPSPNFLTVGTYPLKNASAALEEAAQSGGGSVSDGDGFRTLTGGPNNNAYIVFDDQPDLQIEVFSPDPGKASELVESGAVEPID